MRTITVEELSTEDLELNLKNQMDHWPKDKDGKPYSGNVTGRWAEMNRAKFDNSMEMVAAIQGELGRRKG